MLPKINIPSTSTNTSPRPVPISHVQLSVSVLISALNSAACGGGVPFRPAARKADKSRPMAPPAARVDTRTLKRAMRTDITSSLLS